MVGKNSSLLTVRKIEKRSSSIQLIFNECQAPSSFLVIKVKSLTLNEYIEAAPVGMKHILVYIYHQGLKKERKSIYESEIGDKMFK